jgi:glycerol-3-phosphate dehydrogenase
LAYQACIIGEEKARRCKMDFSFRERQDNLERLGREEFDIVVIGGGITGAGIAWDAALRGFSTALIEKGDFGSGTSSRSSRLIHGGLRYLRYFQVDLVYEACQERFLLLRHIAPHMVRPLPFIYPVYKGHGMGLPELRVGMWLYDLLAFSRRVGRYRMLGPDEALKVEPALEKAGLKGAAFFYDCLGNDSQITLATVKAAYKAGAVPLNYVEAIGLLKSQGKVRGVAVRDVLTGKELEVKAKLVVNAAGPWADQILAMDSPSYTEGLRLTKGIHLVVRRERIGNQNAMTISSPRDGRFVFLIPWWQFTIIGTTDTDYQGDPDIVYADAEDVDYLLEAVNHTLPHVELRSEDVISTFAAIRPLAFKGGASPYEVSRKHRIFETPGGMLCIAGGKFTTYRKMACDLVDKAAEKLAKEFSRFPKDKCRTYQTPLPGGELLPDGETLALWEKATGLSKEQMDYLSFSYGSELENVVRLIQADSSLAEPIVPGLPYVKAQIIHAVRHQMAITLKDFMVRRTRILYEAPDGGLGAAPEVARLMAAEQGWDQARVEKELADLRQEWEKTQRFRRS